MKIKESIASTNPNLKQNPQWLSLQTEPDHLKAIETCHALLLQYPDSESKSDIYCKLGDIHYSSAKDIKGLETAATYFEHATAYDPNDWRSFYSQIRVREDIERREREGLE